MRQPPTNICPRYGRPCIENDCAWWNSYSDECTMTSIASSLSDIASNFGEATGYLRQKAEITQNNVRLPDVEAKENRE